VADDLDTAADVYTPLMLKPNVDEFTTRRNRKVNRAGGWRMLLPPDFHLSRCALVGGGPTLPQYTETIAELRADGVSVITMNGSHDWCLQNGIFPDAHLILDARPHNARFTARPVAGTRYLINEDCHPSILKSLPKAHTYLWSPGQIRWGSTVMLCAPSLLQLLGAHEFHFFGFDSCLSGDKHHAYSQPENDGESILEVPCQEQVFRCTPWMLQQAEEFLELARHWGAIQVYGDGLIATMLRED